MTALDYALGIKKSHPKNSFFAQLNYEIGLNTQLASTILEHLKHYSFLFSGTNSVVSIAVLACAFTL